MAPAAVWTDPPKSDLAEFFLSQSRRDFSGHRPYPHKIPHKINDLQHPSPNNRPGACHNVAVMKEPRTQLQLAALPRQRRQIPQPRHARRQSPRPPRTIEQEPQPAPGIETDEVRLIAVAQWRRLRFSSVEKSQYPDERSANARSGQRGQINPCLFPGSCASRRVGLSGSPQPCPLARGGFFPRNRKKVKMRNEPNLTQENYQPRFQSRLQAFHSALGHHRPPNGHRVARAVSVVLPFLSYPQSRAQWEVCAFGGHRSHQ